MRQRRQREVQKVNEYYYDFLREGLPPGPLREEAFNPSPNLCEYYFGTCYHRGYIIKSMRTIYLA